MTKLLEMFTLCRVRNELTHQGPFFNRTTAIWTAVASAAFLLALRLMGRLWIAEEGFGIFTSDAWSTVTSQLLFDPYSLSHVLHGVVFFYALQFFRKRLTMPWMFFIAILIEMAWEIFENTPFIINRYRTETASLNYFGDSILNSFGDLLSMFAGLWLAARLSWKIVLPLFLGIELIMLFTIRDNLTLNIIMLLYPIPGISEWQQAH